MRLLKTKHVTVPLKRPLLVNYDNIDDPSDPDVPASTSAFVSTGSSRVVSEAAGPSASNVPKQSAITQYISKPISLTKSKAIDLQITKFIVKHFHPFSLVEETEFHNLMLAPNYIVPSRKTISNSLLIQMYESVLEKVKTDLHDVSAVFLTTDGWTSINNQHYIALTVHFLNSETKLCSRLIGCINYNEQCTSVELAKFLMTTVEAWNIEDKISAVVTDNASNIVNAVKKNNWRHVPCFAHVLYIGIQRGLTHLKTIMTKIKNIVEFFKQSSGALHKLQKHQKQMGLPDLMLIQECKTRWNSAYHTIEEY
ncbi:zinc finger BED domain-containing protein 1-like [Acyrthosiphon pisum]|uniref:Zinc finger BED domain-containing protein 1-like n=1 Tax=Acyrthosiphon pisum TaxID=7029 RepID=A0A8R2D576_ACYPI|nr:zinc finger BED domain-containing protein 1-like [Acyrthosiphon pisum]|eukprot:XP_016661474.1 PREDICTED: zinc finger BED domain-containing protein 1-like [Acyrthosiphon pisum]